MPNPEHPDHGEAEGIGADRGRDVADPLAEASPVRIGDVQDQQGQCDREDAIAQCDGPVVVEFALARGLGALVDRARFQGAPTVSAPPDASDPLSSPS